MADKSPAEIAVEAAEKAFEAAMPPMPAGPGFPAARVTDPHLCPLVDPALTPHVGLLVGPPGVANVLIGGLPAAPAPGNLVACTGTVQDATLKGSTKVYVGGQMLARMGDQTLHGGVITAGCPTVLVGG